MVPLFFMLHKLWLFVKHLSILFAIIIMTLRVLPRPTLYCPLHPASAEVGATFPLSSACFPAAYVTAAAFASSADFSVKILSESKTSKTSRFPFIVPNVF